MSQTVSYFEYAEITRNLYLRLANTSLKVKICYGRDGMATAGRPDGGRVHSPAGDSPPDRSEAILSSREAQLRHMSLHLQQIWANNHFSIPVLFQS